MTGALSDPDRLAGVVDLFGALSRAELVDAVSELAFKRGADLTDAAVSDAVDLAMREYYLVACPVEAVADAPATAASSSSSSASDSDGDTADGESADESLVTVGPVAFPSLPEGAADLPHILDVPVREVDRDVLARDVEARLRGDAARAVHEGDEERIAHLLDVTYDLEAWADADVSAVRDRLDRAL